MKLSILLCTIPRRVGDFLPELVKELDKQAKGRDVEVIYLGDNKKRSVGEKRNNLLSLAKGDYVSFIDDDDWISEDYVDSLLEGIEKKVDVVCFEVLYMPKKKRVVYDAKFVRDRENSKYFERLPNHIMCIKRSLALGIGFENMSFGEDALFAKKLKRRLSTQAMIKKVLYYYRFSYEISETQ